MRKRRGFHLWTCESIKGKFGIWLSKHLERPRFSRRRKRAVEFGKILAGELKIERGAVLADVLGPPRSGNDDEAVARQQPRERYLRRRGVVPFRDASQRSIVQHPALLDRRVRHHRHVVLAAPGSKSYSIPRHVRL